jgi:prevent-host-death family protein
VSIWLVYHGHIRRSTIRWNIGQAKQRFSEVVRRAATEPQLICNRNRVVAAVIDAESADRLRALRARDSERSIAEAFDEFRQLVKRQRYRLKTPPRRNRRDAFADALDDVSR